MAFIKGIVVGCPYKDECVTKVRNRVYCDSAKHLKCIEFQIVRSKKNKGLKRS